MNLDVNAGGTVNNTVLTRFYDAPPLNRREILRYAGCSEVPDKEILAVLDECLEEIRDRLSYKVCYSEFLLKYSCKNNESLSKNNDIDMSIDLGFAEVHSKALAYNLRGCRSIILFAATIGIEIDRLIAKYSRISAVKALFFQAIGAERIESLCDAFCKEMRAEAEMKGLFLRPRFSPGYGDLSLALQKDIFAVLDCPRKIGITLNESLLMSPSKSVTAIIGVCDEKPECADNENKCESCTKQDCTYRREEK